MGALQAWSIYKSTTYNYIYNPFISKPVSDSCQAFAIMYVISAVISILMTEIVIFKRRFSLQAKGERSAKCLGNGFHVSCVMFHPGSLVGMWPSWWVIVIWFLFQNSSGVSQTGIREEKNQNLYSIQLWYSTNWLNLLGR